MLLDSNVVIYAAEPNYDHVRRFIAQKRPVVSVINKVEVLGYHKLTPENQQKTGKTVPDFADIICIQCHY